jgi:hypothetical protein
MPALLAAAAATRSRKILGSLGVLYLLIVIQPYALTIGLASRWYLWPAPAWLVWYLLARRSARPAEHPTPSASIPAASLS